MLLHPEILVANNFFLELALDGGNDIEDATFKECRGLTEVQDLIEFCEVTPQKWGQASCGRMIRTKIPGNSQTETLILRRGMTKSITLWKWFKSVREGNWANQRRSGSLTIYDQGGNSQARFKFSGAWAVKYIASDVDSASEEIEIEEIQIAFESFEREI